MTTASHAGDAARDRIAFRHFKPSATIKCMGAATFRSQRARDYACLMDFDPAVLCWRAATRPMFASESREDVREHLVDFIVERVSGRSLVEVLGDDHKVDPAIADAAARQGFAYEPVRFSEFGGPRLQNARDLLRYAGWVAPLGDRVRILAALGEIGTLSFAECLAMVREARPMETIVAMILSGFIEVDIDESLLGPDTAVRRASR